MVCRTCCEYPVIFVINLFGITLHPAVHRHDGMSKYDIRFAITIDIVVNRHIARDFIDIPSQHHAYWRLYDSRFV